MNKISFRECEDGGYVEKSEGVVFLLEKKFFFRGNKREGEGLVRRKWVYKYDGGKLMEF